MALPVTNDKSIQVTKADLREILRDYARNNNVPVPEDVTISFLVDKGAFGTASDNTPTLKISWTETEND